jgi:histone H3/H4
MTQGEIMENLIVVSKVKKYIKEKYGFNTSSNFFEPLNKDLVKAISDAVEHTKGTDRKTVMGRDFNFYIDKPEIGEILVVASKIKAYIKTNSDLSTSKQVMEQLTVRIQKTIEVAAQKATEAKRKTIMDRDLEELL